VFSITISPVPAVGTEAPDFTLRSSAKRDITLSSYRGHQPVLLAFFPLAFTGTCTREMCAFRDDYSDFEKTGVAILPISVDSTDTLREYRDKLGSSIEMLSDFRREVSARYGVLMMDRFYANRAYFLIDRDGVIRWVHVEDVPGNRRENSEILARIAELN
jgi:peroxiredoxin (alkyl hydroperoxide reductase subunit C)